MDNPPPTSPQLSELVADEIRAEMSRRRITQSILADRLHEHPTWVSRRLTGRRIPLSLDDVERIAAVLDVSPQSLFDRALAERVSA